MICLISYLDSYGRPPFNFSQEYLDYDISRQIELESYGYRFLRLNKFNLRPNKEGKTKADVLDRLLKQAFAVE